jgi:hypothetical protein
MWFRGKAPKAVFSSVVGEGWLDAMAAASGASTPGRALSVGALAALATAIRADPSASRSAAADHLAQIVARHDPIAEAPARAGGTATSARDVGAADGAGQPEETARLCCDAIEEELEKARHESETEILAAGGKLSGIYQDSAAHASSLKDLHHRFVDAGASGSDTFAHVVNEQAHSLAELPAAFDRIREGLDVQRRLTTNAAEHTSRILALAATVGKITNTINILGMNALVTAAHAREHGAAFAVVAKELRELGVRTKEANHSISVMAGELSRLLPELRDNGVEIALLCQTQAAGTKDLATRLRHRLQTTYAGIQASLASAVREAVERGESIAANCNDALSHLMFQDRLSQRLVSTERIARIWLTGPAPPEETSAAIQKLRVGAERLAAIESRPAGAPIVIADFVPETADAGELTFL